MEVIVGKTAGFCPGVSNAVLKAEKYLDENKEMYCLGELVHNSSVVAKLTEKGLKTVENIEEVPSRK